MQIAPLVGVCGPIGVGKTTVVAALARELEFEAWPERVDDNPFFARYLANRARWAFHSQAGFIVGALEDARAARRQSRGGVLERPAEEMLEVFCRYLHEYGALDDEELALLTRLALGDLSADPPDLLILLRGDPAVVLERIRQRGRAGEGAYTLRDLERLEAGYTRWRSRLDPRRFLEVDAVGHDLRAGSEIAQLAADARARLADSR